MEVRIVSPTGFCYGIKEAFNRIENLFKEGYHLYYHYPLLNNEYESLLINQKYHLHYVDSLLKTPIDPKTIFIFPAHGGITSDKDMLEQHGIKYVELTCPFVQRNYDALLKDASKHRYFLGKKDHMETRVAKSLSDKIKVLLIDQPLLKKLDGTNAVIFLQTTLDKEQVDGYLKNNFSILPVVHYQSICREPELRLRSLTENASNYEMIIVVGSASSSNANKLYNHALKINPNSFLISKLADLGQIQLSNYKSALIVGATSTSFEEIEQIKQQLEKG